MLVASETPNRALVGHTFSGNGIGFMAGFVVGLFSGSADPFLTRLGAEGEAGSSVAFRFPSGGNQVSMDAKLRGRTCEAHTFFLHLDGCAMTHKATEAFEFLGRLSSGGRQIVDVAWHCLG